MVVPMTSTLAAGPHANGVAVAAPRTRAGHRARARPRPRSIVPGRQRWEVDLFRGRPGLARVAEASLRRSPGIADVRVNPVTGRVLLRHDRTLGPRDAARLLHAAVERVLTALHTPSAELLGRDPAAPPDATGATAHPPAVRPGRAPGGPARRLPRILGAGCAVAAALAGGPLLLRLLRRPLLTLGAAAAATAAVVRRAWHRTDRAREGPGAAGPRGHAVARIVGRHRRRFAVATLLSALSTLAEMALFALTPSIVLLIARGGSATLARYGITGVSAQLGTLAGAGAFACAVMAGTGYAAGVAWRGLAQDVEDDWRIRTYAHVQSVAPADLEDARVSRVNAVLSEDVGQLGTFVGTNMHDVVQMGAGLALLVPMFLLLAPQLAWIAFAPIPLVTWLSFRFHERAVADTAACGERRAELNSRVTENLHAHTTIKAATTEAHEIARIDELNGRCSEANRSAGRSAALPPQILRLAGGSALVGTVLLGGRAVLRGELATAAFGPLIELPGIAMLKLSRVGSASDHYQRTLAALDRIEGLHRLPVEPAGPAEPPAELPAGPAAELPAGPPAELPGEGRGALPPRGRGRIELRKVTFAYPGRPPALRDTSLVIPPGRTTALVGTTGAGKTTVAKLLMRFRHPDRGQVLLDGADVRGLALPDLRRTIGYVTQEPFLFDATIAENIRYGTFDATEAQLVAAARTAGAHTFIDSLPDGYDTRVGERGSALSGGQRQRIALARTVLRDPPVVILDEATSAVDNETEATIQRALQVFGIDRTMLVIAHRLSTVQGADRIYVMAPGGQVAERGTHDELVARGGVYSSLWKLQSGGSAHA